MAQNNNWLLTLEPIKCKKKKARPTFRPGGPLESNGTGVPSRQNGLSVVPEVKSNQAAEKVMATKTVGVTSFIDSEGVQSMPRGRRPKTVKTPGRLERCENIRQRILSLTSDLVEDGFGTVLLPPAPVKTICEPLLDPKTGGWIAHVEEPLGTYIQRVSVVDNCSQRPPFDHVEDPIYRRLIKDFIKGAAMPESKVAALSKGKSGRKAE